MRRRSATSPTSQAGSRLQGHHAAARRPRRCATPSTRLRTGRATRKPDIVLGAEARGYITGGALACRLGCGFVPARKPGKLPWRTVAVKYALEYGFDQLEVHADSIRAGQRVLIHDDVLATGGTAKATVELVEQLGGVVVGPAVHHRAHVPGRPGAPPAARRALADRILKPSAQGSRRCGLRADRRSDARRSTAPGVPPSRPRGSGSACCFRLIAAHAARGGGRPGFALRLVTALSGCHGRGGRPMP